MNNKTFVLLVLVMVVTGFPFTMHAQKNVDTAELGQDIASTAQQAEETIANVIPPQVKAWFTNLFAKIEEFRLEQVAYATTKRDALADEIVIQEANRDQSVQDNRDAVLEGESQSLYSGAGERLREDVSIGNRVKYYAYKFYAGFVSSPIFFYIVGSFLVVYILSTIFRRFRSRGSVE